MTNEIIILVIIIALIVYYLLSKSKTIEKTSITLNDFVEIKKHFINDILAIIKRFNLTINPNMVLAVIKTESGTLFKIKENKDVTADNGFSIGYMQVSEIAMKDVNYHYLLGYVKNDLYDYYKNLTVGILYLQLCYDSAKKSANQIWLTFKKYNGGIDETDNSININASKYADKTLENYKIFMSLS